MGLGSVHTIKVEILTGTFSVAGFDKNVPAFPRTCVTRDCRV